LEVIERLILAARSTLNTDGWLVMEISGTIVDGVKRLLQEWREVRITNDLQGIPRIVCAKGRTERRLLNPERAM
jgi:methylase of polypeptide subunit release factors